MKHDKEQQTNMYGYFKRQSSEIAYEMTWKWQRKGNLEKETESFLIAAQKNVIRTKDVKVKINKT